MSDPSAEVNDDTRNSQSVLEPRQKRARTSVKHFPILEEYLETSEQPAKNGSTKRRGRGRPRKTKRPIVSKDTPSTSASLQNMTTNSLNDVSDSEIQIIEQSVGSSSVTEDLKRENCSLNMENRDESPELQIIEPSGIPVYDDDSEEIQILSTPEKSLDSSADPQDSSGSEIIIIDDSPVKEEEIPRSPSYSHRSSDSSVQIIETPVKKSPQSSDDPMDPYEEEFVPKLKSFDRPEVITLCSSQSLDSPDSWDIVACLPPHEKKTSRKPSTRKATTQKRKSDKKGTSKNEEGVQKIFIKAFANDKSATGNKMTTVRITRSSSCKSPLKRVTRSTSCLSQKTVVSAQLNTARFRECSVVPAIPKVTIVKQPKPKPKKKTVKAPTTKKKETVVKVEEVYVPMVNIFSESDVKVEEKEIEETVHKFFAMYKEIHEESNNRAQDELKDEFAEWLNADPFAGQNPSPSGLSIDVSKANITGEQKVTVNRVRCNIPCTSIEEEGGKRPTMEYYMPIEMNFKGVDGPRLTNMPFFSEHQNDRELFDQLTPLFPDGIHGSAKNYFYINDYLLYRMLRKALEAHQADENPDLIYYCIYRLFPSKLGQRGLSDQFPSLCERFAEVDFDPSPLEPWKKEVKSQVAPNLSNMECLSCLEHLCVVHGFRKEVSGHFPGGEYDKVSLPLVDSPNDDYCSDECWKHIPPQTVSEVLNPTEQEISDRRVDIYLLKARFLKMEIEDGSFIAISYANEKDIEGTFCEFVARTLDPIVTGPKVSTCKQTYEFLMKEGTRLSEAKRDLIGEEVKQRDYPSRSLAFRRGQETRARQRLKKKFQVQIDEAIAKGFDPRQLRRDFADACKSAELVLMPVVPFVPCRHDGSCNEETEGCSCRENGICTYLCRCDENCVQRFPGCVCSHGQCGTKTCMCFRANWECSPATCRSCGCDDVDGREKGCLNYALTRMAHKKTKVEPSKIAGYGLFLKEPCSKGELITEYVGECITDEEAERRGVINDRNNLSYIFALQTGGAIDAHFAGNNSRFANHNAKRANMDAKTMVVAGEVRIGMYARRDLKADAELTFDYRYSVEHQKGFKSSTVKSVATIEKIEEVEDQ